MHLYHFLSDTATFIIIVLMFFITTVANQFIEEHSQLIILDESIDYEVDHYHLLLKHGLSCELAGKLVLAFLAAAGMTYLI